MRDINLKDLFGEELVINHKIKNDKSDLEFLIKIKHFSKHDLERIKVASLISVAELMDPKNDDFVEIVCDLFDKCVIATSSKDLKKGDVDFIDDDIENMNLISKKSYLKFTADAVAIKLTELKKK